MINNEQYQELLTVFPGVPVIGGHTLWNAFDNYRFRYGEVPPLDWWHRDEAMRAPQMAGRPEEILANYSIITTARIEMPFSNLKTLFKNKAARAITYSPEITPAVPGCYEVFLFQAEDGNYNGYAAIIEKKYIDIPLAIENLLAGQNRTVALRYLDCFNLSEIQRCMHASELFKEFQAYVKYCGQGLADSLTRKIHGLDESLIFSNILEALSVKEMLALRCVSPSDEDIIKNRDKTFEARQRFDRKYGLTKI